MTVSAPNAMSGNRVTSAHGPTGKPARRRQRRRAAALLLGLFGGGEGWGLRCGEDGGGFFGDAGAFEEARVLCAPQLDRVGEGEGAEIVGGDVAVLDQLVGLGQWVTLSITSKWPISELKIALSFDPNGLLRPNAVAFMRSSASQPK
jgi:hypothetical protein